MKEDNFYMPHFDYFGDVFTDDEDGLSSAINEFLENCDLEFEDVKLFQQKFGMLVHDRPVHLTKRKLRERADFMQEELNEFIEAVEKQDMAGIADALVDLVYVAKGTAVSLGLPWRQLWNEVQRANMDKVRGIGKRGAKVDCIKPEGWRPPNIDQILIEAKYAGPVAKEEWIDDAEHTNNI